MKYPLLFRALRRAAVVLAFLSLAACGGGSSSSSSSTAYQTGTYPRFDPATKDLPLNTDLVFAAASATDGTADVGTPTNPVEDAINDMDGWSTSAAFDIAFSGSIDPATVCAWSPSASCTPNVFVLPLNTDLNDGDALNPDNIDSNDPFDSANFASRFRPVSAAVISRDGGTDNVLRITPQQPLLSKTKYLVFVTTGVKDANGDPITRSSSFNTLGYTTNSVPSTLQPVRDAVKGWNSLASLFLLNKNLAPYPDAATDMVAISYTFTTTDPGTPLQAMSAPRAAIVQMQVAQGVSPSTAVSNAQAIDANPAIALSTPKHRSLGISAATGLDFGTLTQGQLSANVGKLYTGYIKMPYYLTAPTSQSPSTFGYLTKFWRPNQALAGALGVTLPQDTDGSYNVTYRFPFAAQTSVESWPLQVTLPDATYNSATAGTTCGNVEAAGGYPVVIYIHGITSDRTSVVSLAHTLAQSCIATVAIDLPVHGVPSSSPFYNALNMDHGLWSTAYPSTDQPRERHFEVVQNPTSGAPQDMNLSSPSSSVDISGAWFINLGWPTNPNGNLGTLQNTRDNLREAVMDLLNLNASLGVISQLDLDSDTNNDLNLNKVSVVGVSLGSIVGSMFVTANQEAIAADQSAGLTSNLTPIKAAALSVGGSQLTQVLLNSPTFYPRIAAGLAAGGVVAGTTDFDRFIYTAQSTVASGDPVNFVQSLGNVGVPVLFQEVVGDQVVPNNAADAPLAGTDPFAGMAGASQVSASGTPYDFTSMGNALVKIVDPDTLGAGPSASHPSLLVPASGPSGTTVTAEMQAEVVQMVGSLGQQVYVGSQSASSVQPAP